MDVIKTLRGLYQEKHRLDAAIAILEGRLQKKPTRATGRRGRKSMSPEEREAASVRMRRYWEKRRREQKSKADPVESAAEAAAVSA